jgi:antitoxin PrlF
MRRGAGRGCRRFEAMPAFDGLAYPYFKGTVRSDAAARLTSKGQVTVPKAVRDALGLKEGDEVIFRVEGNRAVLARTPDFLTLADSVRVPAVKRNVAWDEVIRRTRAARAADRR